MGTINIEGVIVTPLKQIFHPKGNIYHGMKNVDPGFNGFGEAYFSTISKGEIKAWKKHLQMTLNLVCPVGCIRFVLFDDRVDSPTKGLFQEVELSTKVNYARLTIPPGIWMGFQALTNDLNLLLNIADIIHDPNEQMNIPIDKSYIVFDWETKIK